MSYLANYDTAITYLQAGFKDRARESLERALDECPADKQQAANSAYINALSLLANLALENGDREKAVGLIERGLETSKSHPDLLYLSALCRMDEKDYDSMLNCIVQYLSVLVTGETDGDHFLYTSDAALKELFKTLLPLAYKHARVAGQAKAIIKKLLDKTGHYLFENAFNAIDDIGLPGEDRQGAAS